MKTIDEAIEHAREVVKRNLEKCINGNCDSSCLKCAEEHQQLAEWLEDYKKIKNDYIKGYNQGSSDRAEEITKARECGYKDAIKEFAEKIKWEYENATGIPKQEKEFAYAIVDIVVKKMKEGEKMNKKNGKCKDGDCICTKDTTCCYECERIEKCNVFCDYMQERGKNIVDYRKYSNYEESNTENDAEKVLELEKYRKTGLTPEQIIQIDKLYLEKCEEVNKLKEIIQKYEEKE